MPSLQRKFAQKILLFHCCLQVVTLYIALLYFVECIEGRYGLNCSQVCGHCKDKTQCHHISGLCVLGCDTGYRGNQCTQSEFSLKFHKIIHRSTKKVKHVEQE